MTRLLIAVTLLALAGASSASENLNSPSSASEILQKARASARATPEVTAREYVPQAQVIPAPARKPVPLVAARPCGPDAPGKPGDKKEGFFQRNPFIGWLIGGSAIGGAAGAGIGALAKGTLAAAVVGGVLGALVVPAAMFIGGVIVAVAIFATILKNWL